MGNTKSHFSRLTNILLGSSVKTLMNKQFHSLEAMSHFVNAAFVGVTKPHSLTSCLSSDLLYLRTVSKSRGIAFARITVPPLTGCLLKFIRSASAN